MGPSLTGSQDGPLQVPVSQKFKHEFRGDQQLLGQGRCRSGRAMRRGWWEALIFLAQAFLRSLGNLHEDCPCTLRKRSRGCSQAWKLQEAEPGAEEPSVAPLLPESLRYHSPVSFPELTLPLSSHFPLESANMSVSERMFSIYALLHFPLGCHECSVCLPQQTIAFLGSGCDCLYFADPAILFLPPTKPSVPSLLE